MLRLAPRAGGAVPSDEESIGEEWALSPMDSLQPLQEYVEEVNAVTKPVIDQWHKDTQRYQQCAIRFDPLSGRVRTPSRAETNDFHEFRYMRYVELLETKFNEEPKMCAKYDS
eukprot:jgi/Tetstr1/427737/TSEL_017861.t1